MDRHSCRIESPTIDISVVIPVLNEQEGIERCYREVSRVLGDSKYGYELVFVDDGSEDQSLAKMMTFAEKDSRVTLVKLKRNFGQQKAHWAGFCECHGRAVVTFDSDLQFEPESIITLSEKIFEGYDTAGGIRENRQDSLLLNKLPSYIGKLLINKALKIKQKDFGGVKAHSFQLIRAILEIPNSQNQILSALAYSLSKNFIEIPVRHLTRQTGRSKFTILRRMESYLDIYTLFADRPFQSLILLAFLSIFGGTLLGCGILAFKLSGGLPSGNIIILCFFMFFIGVQLFITSLLGEFVVRLYRYTQLGNINMIDKVIKGQNNQEV